MRLLAFDCCLGRLSAGLWDDGEALLRRSVDAGAGQADAIVPMLEGLIGAAGRRWSDLDILAVTVGPGSFTGVRTCVATARALALALKVPVIGVGTLEALAPSLARGRPLRLALDGRRGDYFVQSFDAAGAPIAPPERLPRERLGEEEGSDLVRVGAGEDPLLDASMVAAIARERIARGERGVDGFLVEPLYLRAPDARPAAGRALVRRPERAASCSP